MENTSHYREIRRNFNLPKLISRKITKKFSGYSKTLDTTKNAKMFKNKSRNQKSYCNFNPGKCKRQQSSYFDAVLTYVSKSDMTKITPERQK